MKYYYPVIFYEDPEGGFIGIVPDLPGCLTNGDSLASAMYWIVDAIGTWLEGVDVKDIPAPSKPSEIDTSEYPNAIVNVIEYDSEKYRRYAAALEADNPIKAIKEARHLTIKAMALALEMPYRTLQDWISGVHTPPKWLQKLIVEKIERAI